MAGEDTTEVLRAALAGRRTEAAADHAIDRIYERCTPKLLSYIRLKLGRSLRERLESRDILQATLLKSFQHLEEFRGTDGRSLMAWLARIADREIVDRVDYHHRQRRDAGRELPLDDQPELTARVRSVLSQVILEEQASAEAAALEAALDSLSEAHRQIVLLRMFEELSFREIGEHLGRSEDACRMLFARAMTALTLALAGRGERGAP
jgi:RNA polymerase sigma-70 factor, ECF subfamily